MKDRFIIKGAKPLKGEIDVKGAKNAAFPLIASSLLTDKDVVLDNLPLIEDVFRMLELLQSMGGDAQWIGERKVRINTKGIDPTKIDRLMVSRLRGSILFLGPLLARFGDVELPYPGGDKIGARPVDVHLDALKQAGAEITVTAKKLSAKLKSRPTGKKVIILNEFSVTATENILMFAAYCSGRITIKIADFDYQVQELCELLKVMGVEVEVTGFHEITVKGKAKLSGAEYKLIPDPIEAGTFIMLGAMAKGEVLVRNTPTQFLHLFLKRLNDFGVPLEVSKNSVRTKPWKTIRMDSVQTFVYPGIHSDLQSVLGVLATQAKGSTLLHDPLYEGRIKHLDELNKMGAEVFIADPHRAIINGPSKLIGADLGAFDLRTGAAFICAGLIATGQTTIDNVYQVDRGYEKIEERLQGLGADITRTNK